MIGPGQMQNSPGQVPPGWKSPQDSLIETGCSLARSRNQQNLSLTIDTEIFARLIAVGVQNIRTNRVTGHHHSSMGEKSGTVGETHAGEAAQPSQEPVSLTRIGVLLEHDGRNPLQRRRGYGRGAHVAAQS